MNIGIYNLAKKLKINLYKESCSNNESRAEFNNKCVFLHTKVMDIWIVEQSSGSWDDFKTWNVIAFSCKTTAESWVKENNATLPAKKEKYKEEAKEFDSRYEALLEKYDLVDWDDQNPNFRKWRDELDKLTAEWDEKDMAMEYPDLNNFYIGHSIKLIS